MGLSGDCLDDREVDDGEGVEGHCTGVADVDFTGASSGGLDGGDWDAIGGATVAFRADNHDITSCNEGVGELEGDVDASSGSLGEGGDLSTEFVELDGSGDGSALGNSTAGSRYVAQAVGAWKEIRAGGGISDGGDGGDGDRLRDLLIEGHGGEELEGFVDRRDLREWKGLQ